MKIINWIILHIKLQLRHVTYMLFEINIADNDEYEKQFYLIKLSHLEIPFPLKTISGFY